MYEFWAKIAVQVIGESASGFLKGIKKKKSVSSQTEAIILNTQNIWQKSQTYSSIIGTSL